MAAAFKVGSQKRINDIQRKAFPDHTRAEGQHVCIVVLADHPGRERITANATPNALNLACRHHDPLPRSTENDPKATITRSDLLGRSCTVFRVMRAVSRRRADVHNLPAKRFNVVRNGAPHLKGAVVA